MFCPVYVWIFDNTSYFFLFSSFFIVFMMVGAVDNMGLFVSLACTNLFDRKTLLEQVLLYVIE